MQEWNRECRLNRLFECSISSLHSRSSRGSVPRIYRLGPAKPLLALDSNWWNLLQPGRTTNWEFDEIWRRENPTSDKVHMLETRGQTLINLLCLWTLSSKGIERCIPRTPWKNKSRIMSNKLKPGILLGEIKGAPFQTFSDLLVVGKIAVASCPGVINLWTSWQSPGTPAFPREEMLNPLWRNFSGHLERLWATIKKLGDKRLQVSAAGSGQSSIFSFSNATQAYLLSMWLTQLSNALELETVPTSIQDHRKPLRAKYSKMRFPAVLPISSNPLNLVQ